MKFQSQNESTNEPKIVRYMRPTDWIRYDGQAITSVLAEAKATVMTLRMLPFQKQWVERLQHMELKREVAGTSRIEGADFTDNELDDAMGDDPDALRTRSQRQAHAALRTYTWIASLPDDTPVDAELIRRIHRSIVEGADDDHCPPGQLRRRDENVSFGTPRHRGVEGGDQAEIAFLGLVEAMQTTFQGHDPLVQALASHYHLAAMHPFLDGNGRTARALEALCLRRAGLRGTAFIAMSNYYYDEKTGYLAALAESRRRDHDLTPFLHFALKGVALQGGRLLEEIMVETKKDVFRNMMHRLFNRLKTRRKRVIGQRQLLILEALLTDSPTPWPELRGHVIREYHELKNPGGAVIRDVVSLVDLGAIEIQTEGETNLVNIALRLEWPAEITESEFFERINRLPQPKSHPFLR